VSSLLWQQASEHYSAEQLVELTMLAGLYHAVSFMVNAFGVQHESFAPRFPCAAQPDTGRFK
jgi:alkylhydroperoxidase family enzyme